MYDRVEIALRPPQRPSIVLVLALKLGFLVFPFLAWDNVIRALARGASAGVALASLCFLVAWGLLCVNLFNERRRLLRDALGLFSNDHFLAIESDGFVWGGYRLRKREVRRFLTTACSVKKVRASAGQGSHMSGTDLADWVVVLDEDDDLHIVGSPQRRATAEHTSEAVSAALQKLRT
jgi:hypothetical protein